MINSRIKLRSNRLSLIWLLTFQVNWRILLKRLSWDGNFQIKFFSGIFKMEHLSNRNLIGTFQKLNDRKYHFLRKKWEIIHFWKVKKDFKFRKTKNFRSNHNQKWVIQIFFPKFLFPRILKILLHPKFKFLYLILPKIHRKLLKSAQSAQSDVLS